VSTPSADFDALFALEEKSRSKKNSDPAEAASTTQEGVAVDTVATASTWRREPPATDLVGLGLSGGGIRSATFNLGLLQGLAGLGLLGLFDYLATVSGGGYIGSFWSAWRLRNHKKSANEFPCNGKSGHEPPELVHLRRFGNFLRPRLQWLSFETGRFVAALIGGLVPALTAALTTLAATLLLFLGSVWLLTQNSSLGPTSNALAAALAFLLISLALQFGFEWAWLKHRQEEPEARAQRAYLGWSLSFCVAGAALWWVVWHLVPVPAVRLLTPAATPELGLVARGLFMPVGVWLLLVVLLVTCRAAGSRAEKSLGGRRHLGAIDRVLSRFGLLAVLWSVAAVAWLLGQWVAAEGVGGVWSAVGVAGASGSAFTWLRRLLPGTSAPMSGDRAAQRLKPWLLTGLAFVTIVAIGILVSAGLAKISSEWSTTGLLATAVILGLLIVGILFLFDPHGVSFHSFYRARLVRAYLGATNASHDNEGAECEGDDLFVNQLPTGKPYHLICCAANDLAGDSLATLHRGAQSAVISRQGVQIGGRWRPWQGDELSLGAAMTASGSAFNSHMGSLSMALGWPVTFLLTAFNLRLGRWVRGVDSTVVDRGGPTNLPGWFFFRELLGHSRTGGEWEFLSDGAHFDNLGLYELVRRHCRYILISDCGADPEVAFDDLGNAIRRVREDFGVEITIDTTPLRPEGPERRAERPMVAGEIRYPAGDYGLLLYIKPTLTGDEPSDVAQYASRNKVFPHETTLDQFFDEAQWESYRRLGEHVAKQAFEKLLPKDEPHAADLFAEAFNTWRPTAAEDAGAIEKLRGQWAKLEQRLWDSKAGQKLLAETYPPLWLADLDRGKSPVSRKLTKALPFVRHAVRLLETAHQTTGFGSDPDHAVYRGWRNIVGHWVSSPTVQFWWPWLAPLHSPEFATFVQRVGVGLKTIEDLAVEVTELEPLAGLAWDRWPGRDKDWTGVTLYGCRLRHQESDVLVGLLAALRIGDELRWSSTDFFVAPGFWNVRVGLRFLKKLFDVVPDVKSARVEFTESPARSDISLYPRANFRWKTENDEIAFVWDRPSTPPS
jgi:hypothetical protein